MFPDDHKEASTFGRRFLESLSENNGLKPVVWAEHKINEKRYGVSLGVRPFVRPLYLFIKLSQLGRNVENDELKDVRAIQIRYKKLKDPCVTCQNSFGFMSCAPIGNCAEYDVFGNVNQGLLPKNKWTMFSDACGQHFNAFKKMLSMIEEKRLSSEKITGTYFDSTRSPRKPNVLKCEWNCESKVFEVDTTSDWPLYM